MNGDDEDEDGIGEDEDGQRVEELVGNAEVRGSAPSLGFRCLKAVRVA